MDEERKDDLTDEQTEQAKADGIDTEEEHRYSEFEDIRNRIEELTSIVRSFINEDKKFHADVMGAIVDSGAVIKDGNGDTDSVSLNIEDMSPDFDDLDLTI